MTVSKCANPACSREFRRLGEGRLFVRNTKQVVGPTRLSQRTAWLCEDCCDDGFDLRFDRRNEEFQLMHRRKAA